MRTLIFVVGTVNAMGVSAAILSGEITIAGAMFVAAATMLALLKLRQS